MESREIVQICKAERDTDVENKLMDPKWAGGVVGWIGRLGYTYYIYSMYKIDSQWEPTV